MPHPYLAALVLLAIIQLPLLVEAVTWADRRLRPWVLETVPIALLVCAVAAVYWPFVLGQPPMNTDHGFNILKMLETSQFLHEHRLLGWSDMEGAGFPHNVNYPPAGALLGALLHELPEVDWYRAYAWTVFLHILVMVLALYFAGRLHFTRLTGLLVGLVGLFDPGGWWVGGHFSNFELGMWIQTFSTAFLVAGLALWPLAIERGRTGWAQGAGALLGAAVLFHPQAVVLGASAGVIMLLALLGTRGLSLRQIAAGTAWVAAMALFVCGWWFITYVSAQRFARMPSIDTAHSEWMWLSFTDGTLLRVPGIWMGAALVGVFLLARRGDAFSRFVAILVPSFPVFFTVESLDLLHLRHPGATNLADQLQLFRTHYLMRPLGMLAAAFAVATTLPRALRWVGGRFGGWRSALTRAWVGALAGLLIQLPGLHIPGYPKEPAPQELSKEESNDLGRALDAAVQEVGTEDRLAIRHPDPFNHSLIFPTVMRGVKTEVIGGDAATTFKNRFTTDQLEPLQRIGVTALLSRGALPDPLKGLELIGTYGPFELRRVPRTSRAWMVGPGTVDVLSWRDQEIRLRIGGAVPGKSRVVLGLGYYTAWRSDEGEEPSPAKSGAAPFSDKEEARFSAFTAHNGEMVISYRTPWAQRVGLAISVLGLLGTAALGWRRRRTSAVQLRGPETEPVAALHSPGSP